jgi:ribonucleoside-triphosphate reductase
VSNNNINHDITLSHNILNNIFTDYNHNNANTVYNSGNIELAMNEYLSKRIAEQIIPDDIIQLHKDGLIHIHDFSGFYIKPLNCSTINYLDILQNGIDTSTVQSNPPKHFDTAVNQLLEAMFIVSSNQTGGCGVDLFNTFLSPYIDDSVSDYSIKQVLQNFIFRLNQTNSGRNGAQCIFSSVGLNLEVPVFLEDKFVTLPGGCISPKYTYKDFRDNADRILRIFTEILIEGDGNGNILLFPNTCYNVTGADLTRFPEIFELVAKYGTPYFVNNRDNVLASSMGCRTRIETKNDPFKEVLGTGNNAIITINLPLIAMDTSNEKEFYDKLKYLMDKSKDLLILRNNRIYEIASEGLLDALLQFRNIDEGTLVEGICGLDQTVKILTGESLASNPDKGKEILDFMLNIINDYSKVTGKRFGLASSAAENTAFRFAKKIVNKYGYKHSKKLGAVKGPNNASYVNNGVMIDIADGVDIIERIKVESVLNDYTHSASLINLNLGESFLIPESMMSLTDKINNNSGALFWCYTKNFSFCHECQTQFNGLIDECHLCKSPVEQFSRITGYYQSVKNFNKGKKSELKDRFMY